jgi:hypothetical protein
MSKEQHDNKLPEKKTIREKLLSYARSATMTYCIAHTGVTSAYSIYDHFRANYYRDKTEILHPDAGYQERLEIVDPKNIKKIRAVRLKFVYDEGVEVPNSCSASIITPLLSNVEFVLAAQHCLSKVLKSNEFTGPISEKYTEYTTDGQPIQDYAVVMPIGIFESEYPQLRITEFKKGEIASNGLKPSIGDLTTASCENKQVDPSYIDIGATKIIETKDIKRIFVPGNSGSLIHQYVTSKKGSETELCLFGMVMAFRRDQKDGKNFVKSVRIFAPDSDPKKPWKHNTIQTAK